jgi:hypothetical protein
MPNPIHKPFKHLIKLAPEGFTPKGPTKRQSASVKWKKRAIDSIKMRFYFQVLKADIKLKQRWWNNYCITRIGVPGEREFLCQETFYVATMSRKQDATKFKNYWYWCKRRSLEILIWLFELDDTDYSWKLHIHLRGLIVTRRPMLSEVKRYEAKTSEEIALQVFGKWKHSIY